MNKLFLISFFLIFFHSYSQFGSQNIISTEAQYPVIVFSADIDGDGFTDVLSASRLINNIAWYRNIDGLGNFSPLNLIGLLDEAKSVYAADLDGDGDMDVMATTSFLNIVVWYENLDSQGSFSSQKILSNNADGAFSVIAADLDGDGDMDVISASDVSGLAWYENIDGQGSFSAAKTIDNTIDGSRSVVAVDMNGDGNLDILGNGLPPDQIFWIENINGTGNFGPRHVINDLGFYSNVVYAADIDSDGDMDVLSASPADNEIAWYENLDGIGNFGNKNSITNSLFSTWTVYASDLDNDGDMDVLATSVETFAGEVVWFENLDGLGNFSEKKIISTEVQSPRSVIAADIDNDGDMDVLSASQNDNKIAWYENQTIIGVDENQENLFTIYPNPVKSTLTIQSKEPINSATFYDVLGRKLLEELENFEQLDVSGLPVGLLFVTIKTEYGAITKKIIKE